MVKICLRCHYVNAGGYRCVECGGKLVHTSDPQAQDLPASVWKNQRVDYGARRGMIMRLLAIFIAAFVGLFGVRESFALGPPWSTVVAVASIALGIALYGLLHRAAHRAVRVWILAKGRVHKGRLLRAMFAGTGPSGRRGMRDARLIPAPEMKNGAPDQIVERGEDKPCVSIAQPGRLRSHL